MLLKLFHQFYLMGRNWKFSWTNFIGNNNAAINIILMSFSSYFLSKAIVCSFFPYTKFYMNLWKINRILIVWNWKNWFLFIIIVMWNRGKLCVGVHEVFLSFFFYCEHQIKSYKLLFLLCISDIVTFIFWTINRSNYLPNWVPGGQ